MKILIPTPIFPPKNDFISIFMENVIPFLKKKEPKIIWLIHQPSRISAADPKKFVYDIHDFSDAKTLLQTLEPDCVIVGQTYEPITISISMAANYLKIPVISLYLLDYQYITRKDSSTKVSLHITSLVRNFFSNKVPSDSEYEKKFMRRGRFILYKYNFLIKTKMSLGINFFQIMLSAIKDVIMYVSKIHPEYNKLADLNLLPDKSWVSPLGRFGFKNETLVVTGNPFWDRIYNKIQKRTPLNNMKTKSKIRILVLTDALVEHGSWNTSYRDTFLVQLFSELCKESTFTFSLKLHPFSEDKTYYENLMKKLCINTTIFQLEDLWDIINNFDVVVSYGQSTAHTQLVSGVIKIILLDPRHEFAMAPLVKDSINSGHVVMCYDFKNLVPSVKELLNKKIELTEEFIRERDEIFFQFKGRSGELVANEILRITDRNKQNV